MDREKVIKEFEHILNEARGDYLDFADITVDFGDEILSLLKEHEDLGTELTNAMELIHKKNERIKNLEKQIETLTKWRMNAGAFD